MGYFDWDELDKVSNALRNRAKRMRKKACKVRRCEPQSCVKVEEVSQQEVILQEVSQQQVGRRVGSCKSVRTAFLNELKRKAMRNQRNHMRKRMRVVACRNLRQAEAARHDKSLNEVAQRHAVGQTDVTYDDLLALISELATMSSDEDSDSGPPALLDSSSEDQSPHPTPHTRSHTAPSHPTSP